ncbi:MAG: acyltransferase [Planctomycetota bacterium]|nr:acyltransferase [Planctomycetota bacterium]
MDHATFLANRRFGSLDGLRGLAVAAVVWHHTQRGFAGVPASQRGYLGVDLFFVLSGFLITTLLLRERDDHGRIGLGRFYARRALRIFPLYYGLLLVLIALFLVRPQLLMAAPFFEDLPHLATYTTNWVPSSTFLVIAWSLAAEEQFYLAWPPTLKVLGASAHWILGAVFAIGVAVGVGVLDPLLSNVFGPGFRSLDMVQATFNPIVLGVWVASLLHAPAGFAKLRALLGARAAAPVTLVLVVALANVPTPEPFGWPRLVVQVALATLVASCVVREDHGLARLLQLPPLVRLGVVSYGIYLLHMFVLQGTRPLVEDLGLRVEGDRFAVTLLAAWLVAELSFRFLEAPCLRRKERFRPSSRA